MSRLSWIGLLAVAGLLLPCVGRAGSAPGQQERGAVTDPKAEPDAVKVQPPWKISFQAIRDGDLLELTSVTITGANGQQYLPTAPGDLFAWYIAGGGKELEVAKLSYG